jgi:hypothetical protein
MELSWVEFGLLPFMEYDEHHGPGVRRRESVLCGSRNCIPSKSSFYGVASGSSTVIFRFSAGRLPSMDEW